METIQMEVEAGLHITKVCKQAVNMARAKMCRVEFEFNGITIAAKPDREPDELVAEYRSEAKRRYQEQQEGKRESKTEEAKRFLMARMEARYGPRDQWDQATLAIHAEALAALVAWIEEGEA